MAPSRRAKRSLPEPEGDAEQGDHIQPPPRKRLAAKRTLNGIFFVMILSLRITNHNLLLPRPCFNNWVRIRIVFLGSQGESCTSNLLDNFSQL